MHVQDVTRNDILKLLGAGREEDANQKTINRRAMVLLVALRNAGATIKLQKGDWPKTVDNDVDVCSQDEIKAFFDVCAAEEKLLFQVYLATGFRFREVNTLTWDRVDFRRNVLWVKPDVIYGFKPKNHEVRSVKVPSSLIESLKQRQKSSKTRLVFPTRPHPKRPSYGGDQPDAHHLELCKEVAFRAELNCGHCKSTKGKCATTANCERWYLHRWRDSFATNLLRSGVDIKTLQTLLGHKKLSTTEKYLAALRMDELDDKVEGYSRSISTAAKCGSRNSRRYSSPRVNVEASGRAARASLYDSENHLVSMNGGVVTLLYDGNGTLQYDSLHRMTSMTASNTAYS
ncbi:site-specific integrase [Alloacidobacterium dinghuense]|uniref:Site-specific integrase n=1 Tax=Alloacidobacterium dinghuense TaxID=2763107 RepID=A0A7G8BN68_9BACT|nr:site-specific integrase [Alloacidobacterium dinghuense]QNI33988.1 site-specific integrase [Alloacidobacterium dinghuense]